MSSSTASSSPGRRRLPEAAVQPERRPPVAVWIVGPGHVELRDEEARVPGAHDVRVAAIASGVSAGSELLVYRGLAPVDLKPDLPTVAGTFRLPVKFGYANVGRVVEVGDAVDGLVVGDLVFTHHPHQSEYVVPADFPLRLPADASPEVAVFTANLETAVTIVLDAAPRLGEAVLVVGQGIVGLLVTMLLARTGARPIITVDAHETRRAASRSVGAHHVLAPGDRLGRQVLDVTEGRGADAVVEVSGEPTALQACVDAAAFGGTVVVASWYGTRRATLDLGGAFHRRRLRLVSSQVSTLDAALGARWTRERRAGLVTTLLRELPLDRLISHRFVIRDAGHAYRLLDERPAEALQVILRYDGSTPDGAR